MIFCARFLWFTVFCGSLTSSWFDILRVVMAAWRAFSRSAAVYLLLHLVSLFMRNNVFTSTSKNVGSELTNLFPSKEASSPRI